VSQFCAVLTGDLINSTKTDPEVVERAFEALFKAGEDVRAFDPEGGAAVERYRGDGWQALVRDPRHALRAALLFSAAVASVDRSIATRIAVGFGPVGPLHPTGLGASDGLAFRLSGRLLDEMPKSLRITAGVDRDNAGGLTGWAIAGLRLAGAVCETWTAKQAEVMRRLLVRDPPSQSELADRLGVSQQTVQKHFDSAQGAVLLSAIEQVEGWD
jgi:DNA-binding CsgD family transcriptional regulator